MITNVLQYLEDSAEKNPEKILFADEKESITYLELMNSAKCIGSFIAGRTGEKNKPIAVLIDRNIRSLLAFMGIVYSGNFYVPIDMSMPVQRVELILRTLEPLLILDAAGKGGIMERQAVCVDEAAEAGSDTELLSRLRREAIDTDPLYAIFTSGSTGIPKGVLVNHRSIIDLTEQFAAAFTFPEEPVFGNQAPFDFDVSSKDIYCCLKLGGSLQVIPKRLFSFPVQLIPYLNGRRVNTLIWAVSALRIVADFKTFTECPPRHLKLVMFSGEVMPVKALNYWREGVPEAQYVNLYGPTEITCNCTYYMVDREFRNEESLPIGRPFRNTEILLIDVEDNSRITAPDVIGEICVRGTCLAIGYYNNPEKTKEAFVQNPFNHAYEEKIYRTGDMGMYNERGELMFASRKDYQIKHMGHRIELGEIETAVNALTFIEVGCCIFDERAGKIVLFYQSPESCDKQIVRELSKALPKYMWPNRYVHSEKLPLNKNGKIDRVLLKEEYIQKEKEGN